MSCYISTGLSIATSIYMPVHMPIHMPTHMSIHISINLSIYMPICVPVYMTKTCLYTCLGTFDNTSICISMQMSMPLSIQMPIQIPMHKSHGHAYHRPLLFPATMRSAHRIVCVAACHTTASQYFTERYVSRRNSNALKYWRRGFRSHRLTPRLDMLCLSNNHGHVMTMIKMLGPTSAVAIKDLHAHTYFDTHVYTVCSIFPAPPMADFLAHWCR